MMTETATVTARFGTGKATYKAKVNGSVSYHVSGWGDTPLRVDGEHALDYLTAPNNGSGDACNRLSTLNNRVSAEVPIL